MHIESVWILPFPPATVFAAWVSNDTVIPPATRMDIKPEAGGHYRLYAAGDGFTAFNEGAFIAVEQNRHLRYSWHWEGDEETTEVDVLFSDHADGTELQLHHGMFLSEDSRSRHSDGWDSYVAGLGEYLTRAQH